jgi:glycosyltransferase involved in cell wall biosynthesis
VAGKGHLVLLRAFRDFVRIVPSARLIVIGDGPERSVIERTVEELGLRSYVLLTGCQNDIPGFLAALDVFTLPSFDEGIPMTILEAMAAGLPVVATAVGGIPQVVMDGETGILVPPHSSDSIVTALSALYDDRKLASRMGTAGRRRVQERFDSGAMVDSYERLYLSLLSKGARV